MRYKIVRHFENGRKRVIERGLTLEEAQAHCKDPESSSTTCTSETGRRRTKRSGRWFDGYAEDTQKSTRVRIIDVPPLRTWRGWWSTWATAQ